MIKTTVRHGMRRGVGSGEKSYVAASESSITTLNYSHMIVRLKRCHDFNGNVRGGEGRGGGMWAVEGNLR